MPYRPMMEIKKGLKETDLLGDTLVLWQASLTLYELNMNIFKSKKL